MQKKPVTDLAIPFHRRCVEATTLALGQHRPAQGSSRSAHRTTGTTGTSVGHAPEAAEAENGFPIWLTTFVQYDTEESISGFVEVATVVQAAERSATGRRRRFTFETAGGV